MTKINDTDLLSVICNDLTIKTLKHLSNNNLSKLHQMGFNNSTINCYSKSDINAIHLSFSKAITVHVSVDNNQIKQFLVNESKIAKNQQLIERFIIANATFEMIRYFFRTHTNRKHTFLRNQLNVFSVKFNTKYSKQKHITGAMADEFFSTFYLQKKPIDAESVLIFSQENNYSMVSIWKQFKVFIKNTEKEK